MCTLYTLVNTFAHSHTHIYIYTPNIESYQHRSLTTTLCFSNVLDVQWDWADRAFQHLGCIDSQIDQTGKKVFRLVWTPRPPNEHEAGLEMFATHTIWENFLTSVTSKHTKVHETNQTRPNPIFTWLLFLTMLTCLQMNDHSLGTDWAGTLHCPALQLCANEQCLGQTCHPWAWVSRAPPRAGLWAQGRNGATLPAERPPKKATYQCPAWRGHIDPLRIGGAALESAQTLAEP